MDAIMSGHKKESNTSYHYLVIIDSGHVGILFQLLATVGFQLNFFVYFGTLLWRNFSHHFVSGAEEFAHWDFAIIYRLHVHFIEVRMIESFLSTNPLLGIFFQHFAQKIQSFWRYFGVYLFFEGEITGAILV